MTLLLSVVVIGHLLITTVLVGVAVFLLVRLDILKGQNQTAPMLILILVLANIGVGTVVTFFLIRIPMRPVNLLIDQMNRLASGDYKVRIRFGKILSHHGTMNELAESFNKLAQELESTEMLRSDFINNFSHEFKTPIVSISGFAKLLQKGNLTEEQQAEYLSIIETESEKLSNMAMNVLDMSKLDNVGVLTDITRFNLSEQLRHCVLMLEKKWGEKNQEIEIDLPEYYVSGNEDMLSEVWINLLDNAIKFSPEGGKIIVKVFQRDNSLSVEVRNTGEEIPGKDLDRIFDKFYQTDPSHATVGNGLGLSICKRIVELHRGTISVTSTFGLTVFTVKLPKV